MTDPAAGPLSCEREVTQCKPSVYWRINLLAAILQTTIWNAFRWEKIILIHISLKCDRKGPIDNKTASVQVMAWQWLGTGDKPLPEPMMTQFTDVIRPQCVGQWQCSFQMKAACFYWQVLQQRHNTSVGHGPTFWAFSCTTTQGLPKSKILLVCRHSHV